MRFRDWAFLMILIVVIAVSLLMLFTGAAHYTDTP
jgi:hypothetical protein